MNHDTSYRPEIDGLRALAVSMVIIYHAGLGTAAFGWAPGGLVGVDVFFVISGYLITGIIQRDLDSFSILDFYQRRTRRIMPVLFLVILSTIPVAFFVLHPRPFYEFSNSARAAVAFVSNIYFWRLDSYTAEASQYQPLLHTWSLGVEEQYYLLFPAVLVLIWKFSRRHLTAFIILAFLFSLALMLWAGAVHPDAAFYLLPTRGWELMAGALVARAEQRFGRQANSVLPAIGVVTIVGPALLLGDELQQPSLFSILPVVGTCLVIGFARSDIVARLLSSKPLVGLGLISFSVYLWHQPVLAFARVMSPDPVPPIEVVAQMAGVIAVSWLTWRFVENPFRDRSKWAFGAVAGIVAVMGAAIFATTMPMDGVKHTQEGQPIANMLIGGYQEVALEKDGEPCHARWLATACRFGDASAQDRWYVVGDSHASVISASLYGMLRDRHNLLYTNLTTAGCHYAPGLYREKGDVDQCNDFSREWRSELLSAPPSTVVITGRLPLYLSGIGYNNGEGGIEPRSGVFLTDDPAGLNRMDPNTLSARITASLQELVDHGHRLVLIYPPPEPGWNIPQDYEALIRSMPPHKVGEGVTTSYERYLDRSRLAYGVYDAVEGEKVVRIYAEEAFCNIALPGRCSTHSRAEIYYRDDNHLSLYGARIVTGTLVRTLDEISPSGDVGEASNLTKGEAR